PSRPLVQQPWIRLQILERADDAVTDREPRRPSDRLHLRRLEEDEGAIADPAAIATRVGELRRDSKMSGDPADGIVYLAVLVGAEVEDVALPTARLLHD